MISKRKKKKTRGQINYSEMFNRYKNGNTPNVTTKPLQYYIEKQHNITPQERKEFDHLMFIQIL